MFDSTLPYMSSKHIVYYRLPAIIFDQFLRNKRLDAWRDATAGSFVSSLAFSSVCCDHEGPDCIKAGGFTRSKKAKFL